MSQDPNLIPVEGDYAFVWWNTGWKAPEWAGSWYVARVHRVRPYTGPFKELVACIIDLDNSVTSLSGGPMQMSVSGDNPRLLWRTHPNNPGDEPSPI